MKTHASQRASAGATDDPQKPEGQSLEQLLADTRILYADTVGQFRGTAELALMEFELALSSIQWWLWTLALFGVCTVMSGTLLVTATVIAIAETAVSPASIIAVMGVCCALAASVLYLCLKSLSGKMTFNTLRKHLTQAQDEKHGETGA
tara:strand:- start:1062 stop:1508 length:447 start_codon:yes stop_codon:yes gene_type:complete